MADTKGEILDSALDLFAEHGYHGTSMRAIAEKVEIQKSSIYNHFSSKEDIFNELFHDLAPLNLENDNYKSMLEKDKTVGLEVLNYFGELMINEMKDEKKIKLLKIMIKEHNNALVQKKLQKRMKANTSAAARLFENMKKKNMIKNNLDSLLLANEFIGGIIFLRMRYLIFKIDYFDEMAAKTRTHINFFWENIKNDI